MPTIFAVDPRSGIPLYLQLIDQVKRAVALGSLRPGEQLPTVKALALELTINPNTVARAYRDLEREAVIETSPGRGSFVHADGASEAVRGSLADGVERTLDAAIREAKAAGIERDRVRAALDRTFARWYGDEDVR